MARRNIGSACVQFDDATGTVAMDGHDGSVLFDLAEAYGLDTEKYFPFHAEFWIAELSDGSGLGARFYAADRESQGYSFDELMQLARSEGNELKLVTLEPDEPISFELWARRTKRLEISVSRKGLADDIQMYVVD